MSADPIFTGAVLLGLAEVDTANTARDGSGTIATCFTAAGSGVKVEEIVLKATSDPADSVVTIFIDPTGALGWRIYDEVDLGNPAAGSTTVSSYRNSQTYANLWIPASGKLGFAITVALAAGKMNCWAFGGTF